MSAGQTSVLPEAASSRSSLNDTHFLITAESDWTVKRGGGVEALETGRRPWAIGPIRGRGRDSEERDGELGLRNIPGRVLTGVEERRGVRREGEERASGERDGEREGGGRSEEHTSELQSR